MSFSRVTRMSPLQFMVLETDRLHPTIVIWVRNMQGQVSTFKIGSGRSSLLFAGPTATALTGTVTLTSGSPSVVGVGTLFTTELVVGDTVCLANGKVLGKVSAIGGVLALTLEANWAGATIAGATLYKASPVAISLAAFETKKYDFPLVAPDASSPIQRRYLYIENLNKAQLEFGIEYHAADMRTVRDSLTESLLA